LFDKKFRYYSANDPEVKRRGHLLGSNRRLYERQTLIRIRDLLSRGGVFTVWAAERNEAFERRLKEVFKLVETITVKDSDIRGRSTHYIIYRAQCLMALK